MFRSASQRSANAAIAAGPPAGIFSSPAPSGLVITFDSQEETARLSGAG
jgi:hypothetical protein